MSSRLIQSAAFAFLLVAHLDSQDREPALDDASQRSVEFWNTLGTIRQGQSKLAEAEQDYQRALGLNQSLSSPNKMQRVSILNNLATIQQARRDFSKAEAFLTSGYEILRENNLTNNPGAGPLLANLGFV